MPVIYSNAWGASRARQIAALKKENEPILVLAGDQRQADLLYNELKFFYSGSSLVLMYPEYMHEPFEEVRIADTVATKRVLTLKSICDRADGIIITTPYALLKKIAPPEAFIDSIIILRKNKIFPPAELFILFDRLGYLPVEVVTGSGEYCVRGGIVDLFPFGHKNPVRLEYFDDEIEYLFTYDVNTQKKIAEKDSVELLPASEVLFATPELLAMDLPASVLEKLEDFGKYAGHHWLVSAVYAHSAILTDYLPKHTLKVVLDEQWAELFERVLITVGDNKEDSDLAEPEKAFASLTEIKAVMTADTLTVVTEVASAEDAVALKYRSVKSRFAFEKKNLYQSLSLTLKELKAMQADGFHTVVSMESERFISLLEDFCRDHEVPLKEICSIRELNGGNTLYLYNQRLSGGFIDEKAHLVCVTDEEIFGFVRKRTRTKPKEGFSTSLSDLEENDYVVHIDYGIGVYRGLRHMVMGGMEGDYLEIVYENNEILYVPLEQISQIQKYIGVGDAKPKIANLQSTNWSKLKASARVHAAKIAQDLLKLYAERKARKGFSFKGGESMLFEFEEHFPYDETEDQLSAIHDVYRDMESEVPMERLVCGDVGFGKTEVAMRAACKAVLSGKQVAMLVPTTVLARQHYNTFKRRFGNIAVNIDYISRFRSSDEIRKIKKKLPDGETDIIIGTHRLLSKDIVFKDLGLLVIDEEQRFGVAHKEKISAMRSNIDVLSLSATPIPRTLQLSLSGIRDISTIETPPENRLPIAVKVIRTKDDIQKAVIKELERGGQVFFLHNKIKDISGPAEDIKRLVPHARIAVAHGQTPNAELEKILKDFYDGEIDVLVSTTIIENGIDIPNVNAIIIDDAANFGLSQLYQLKGRVGRSQRRGYCYLFVENFNALTPIAKKRLSIIQQLSELGSGLKIAMYDLQLRGAGDILGAQQSGFVVKVGYELFLKMISEAVAELQESGDTIEQTEIITQYPYYISADYIEEPRIRLDYYKLLSGVADRAGMQSLLDELESQYGELRDETVNLGYIMLIKNLAGAQGIVKAGVYPKMMRFTFSPKAEVNPVLLTSIAENLKLKYRFANEFEFVLAFPVEEQTLVTGMKFLELLSAQEKSGD